MPVIRQRTYRQIRLSSRVNVRSEKVFERALARMGRKVFRVGVDASGQLGITLA